ncbi:hypothetical protein LIER_13038 [Lithospermum erythrorhizon]|uniref:Uncharacterized protein n=1 Tax=Lithospermum erythrorhizon TaxID=34254 RepID=A0AAV3PVF8_LITER
MHLLGNRTSTSTSTSTRNQIFLIHCFISTLSTTGSNPQNSPPPFTQLNHAHHYISGHELLGYVTGFIPCPIFYR